MRIWNSLFIILFYLVLVKLSLPPASTALPCCLFFILQVSCLILLFQLVVCFVPYSC